MSASGITQSYNWAAANTTGTSLSLSVTSDVGDIVLAAVVVRSSYTVPAGWELLHDSGIFPSSTLGQRLFLLRTVATSTTTNISIVQVSNARLYINLLSIHDAEGLVYHSGSERLSAFQSSNSVTLSRPAYRVVIWLASTDYWTTSSGKWSWSGESNKLVQDSSSTQPRLMCAWDDGTAGTARTFSSVLGQGPSVADYIEVVLPDSPYNWAAANTTGTSLSLSVASDVGDVVLAAVVVRSSYTVPAGWELLHDSGIFPSSTLGQRLFLLQTVATSTTTSISIVQVSNARIYINLLSIHNAERLVYHSGSERLSAFRSSDAVTLDRPTYPIVIWLASTDYWTTSSGLWSWSGKSSRLVQDISSTQPRLMCAWDDIPADTVRTFTSVLGQGPSVADYIEVVLSGGPYKSRGTAVFVQPLTRIMSYRSSEINWTVETPTGTSVVVEAAAGTGPPTVWQTCVNGEEIPGLTPGGDYSGQNLYIRATLATTDSRKTPSLTGITVQLWDTSDANRIVLVLGTGNRNNLQKAANGEVFIRYANGDLSGEDALVDNFIESFIPEGVAYKGNQNPLEHIAVPNAAYSISVKQIYYLAAQAGIDHAAAVTDAYSTVTLTNVGDL